MLFRSENKTTIFSLLFDLQKEIKHRDKKYFVGHIRAHSGLPGPLHEGSALADALTKVRKISWTQEPGGLQFMGFLRQEYLSGLPFPSPVDHILSDLSTVTHPSWVTTHGMA